MTIEQDIERAREKSPEKNPEISPDREDKDFDGATWYEVTAPVIE